MLTAGSPLQTVLQNPDAARADHHEMR